MLRTGTPYIGTCDYGVRPRPLVKVALSTGKKIPQKVLVVSRKFV